ncbi:recombination regulator RecX [Piscinibacter gummiphilus]|uniref:Regulatory protein RecX n=1 Tax=Piscinibacter gummiphilus TaxID=946333 RepID=A0ABZ0CU71_9BURK|nr:recombination regulator RecX [Piscinibacter gummiphilus]WOB08515.1 recombination regulator RecX [Piscinibacter gummiphilus]
MKPRLSLKGRGLQILAQREHSRSELRRKLMTHARKPAGEGEAPVDEDTAAEQVEGVLEWLQANRYLSEERFVESRIHVRAARYGNLRIKQELAQHGVALSAEAAQQLKGSEATRAREVWARKFGQPPQDAAERARQMRFLAARGFSGEAIRRALQGGVDDESA